jgi:hypothetical protein
MFTLRHLKHSSHSGGVKKQPNKPMNPDQLQNNVGSENLKKRKQIYTNELTEKEKRRSIYQRKKVKKLL